MKTKRSLIRLFLQILFHLSFSPWKRKEKKRKGEGEGRRGQERPKWRPSIFSLSTGKKGEGKKKKERKGGKEEMGRLRGQFLFFTIFFIWKEKRKKRKEEKKGEKKAANYPAMKSPINFPIYQRKGKERKGEVTVLPDHNRCT